MEAHLYKSGVGKVAWFVRRFGAAELLLKPLRCAFAPLIIPRLAKRNFIFEGQSLPLFYHRYNMTWANERAIEVPIAVVLLRTTVTVPAVTAEVSTAPTVRAAPVVKSAPAA